MKSYYCKICKSRKNVFSGIKQEVRKHIQEEHMIKSGKKYRIAKDSYESPITKNVGSFEI